MVPFVIATASWGMGVLTSRGWWLLFLIVLQTSLGFIVSSRYGSSVVILGLALLTWFSVEYIVFQYRVHFVLSKIKVRRILKADGRRVPIIWAGQEFDVVVDLVLNSRVPLPFLIVQDRPPSGCERISGRDDLTQRLTDENVISIDYTLRCDVPGAIRFEGLRLQIADIQGLFYFRQFRRDPVEFLVLPPLVDSNGKRRTAKSHNLLPPPGLHRLRSSGSGSELHDLRDYRPGDPPKMIAWKTSARRDRLIIKEFESDVPIRCTLFVDNSESVRVGPPRQTMLNQMTGIASGVAQAALSDRDHVGLVLFDEEKTEILVPARTSRHLIDMLHRLARANTGTPVSPAGNLEALVPLANPLAHEIYPELMDRRINRLPWSMFWRPLFDSNKVWFLLIPLLPLATVIGWTVLVLVAWIFDRPVELNTLVAIGSTVYNVFGSILVPLLVLCLLALFGLMFWMIFGLSGQFPPGHTQRMRRKRLAALLTTLDMAPPGTDALYIDDDAAMAYRLQQFLAEHHRRYPIPLYDATGRYLFRSEGKIAVLARAITQATSRARDNELFVIMADMFELRTHLDPLIRSLRVARARHHQVVVICPWMPGIPIADEELTSDQRADLFRKAALAAGFRGLEAQLFRQTAELHHRSFAEIRHEFGRGGVLIVRAQQHESVRLILNRMDRLRGTRARR